jgi:hypothetical protein
MVSEAEVSWASRPRSEGETPSTRDPHSRLCKTNPISTGQKSINCVAENGGRAGQFRVPAGFEPCFGIQ